MYKRPRSFAQYLVMRCLDCLICIYNGGYIGFGSAWLKIVARDQPNASVAAVDFSFPPSIILVTKHGNVVALGKSKLLWDCGLIHVQGSSCSPTWSIYLSRGN